MSHIVDLEAKTVPTVGFRPTLLKWYHTNSQSDQRSWHRINLWDVGGGPKIRGIWKNYVGEAHGFIFVIDDNLHTVWEALDELFKLFRDETFARDVVDKPMLVLLNRKVNPNEPPRSAADERLLYLSGTSEESDKGVPVKILVSKLTSRLWGKCLVKEISDLQSYINHGTKLPSMLFVQECQLNGIPSNAPDLNNSAGCFRRILLRKNKVSPEVIEAKKHIQIDPRVSIAFDDLIMISRWYRKATDKRIANSIARQQEQYRVEKLQKHERLEKLKYNQPEIVVCTAELKSGE